VIPAMGIYAARITLGKDKLKGICYIGKRPTIVLKNEKINIEAHIFNFDKNIYGKYLEIQFVKMIRPDEKFPSLALLANQIKKDVSSAKKILS
jgi:riboflavin kinase/FMN adenylyltransferase